jgi:hypothetical protein
MAHPSNALTLIVQVLFGTKPSADDSIDGKVAAFLDTNEITVVDDDEYMNYILRAEYCFDCPHDLERFLIKVRERELLDSFFVENIFESQKLLARLKVLRLWERSAAAASTAARQRRRSEAGEAPVTMTFLDRTKNRVKHEELSLAVLSSATRRKKNAVEIWNMKNATWMRFEFETEAGKPRERRDGVWAPDAVSLTTKFLAEAERFDTTIAKHHPTASPGSSSEQSLGKLSTSTAATTASNGSDPPTRSTWASDETITPQAEKRHSFWRSNPFKKGKDDG